MDDIVRKPMEGPWRFGIEAQYEMALHLSADWRLKAVDIDLFGYNLGSPVYFEYKGRLAEYPEKAQSKQESQMSVLRKVANGERPGALFQVGVSVEARMFAFWPRNDEAIARMDRQGCPVSPGTMLKDYAFEAFLYMSRDLPWIVHPDYLKNLEKSLIGVGILPGAYTECTE